MRKVVALLIVILQFMACNAQSKVNPHRADYTPLETGTGQQIKDGDLITFRYEYYDGKSSKVYTMSINKYFVGIYFRNYGSREGWNYSCGKKEQLTRLAKLIKPYKFSKYPQTKLDDEDTSKARWLIKADYDGRPSAEVVTYFDAADPDKTTLKLSKEMDEFFAGIQIYLYDLGEAVGEHTRTLYKPDGKPSRYINYSGTGMVLNGYDYDNPMNCF